MYKIRHIPNTRPPETALSSGKGAKILPKANVEATQSELVTFVLTGCLYQDAKSPPANCHCKPKGSCSSEEDQEESGLYPG